MFRRSAVALTSVVCALLLGSCAQPGTAPSATSSSVAQSSGRQSSAAPSGSTAAASGTSATSFAGNTDPDTSQASADASVTVQNIRIIRKDGFDQVVFDLGGKGTPGWNVRYVDQAASQGKGQPIAVAGSAILEVDITGAGYPYDTGVTEYAGPSPLRASGTQAMTEVVFAHTFEGTTQSFVGTVAKTPFRVYALSNPTRVVLEIADPS